MYKAGDRIVTFLPPNEIEDKTWDQIYNISKLPFIYKHVAVMPDCHLGMGATVGSVIATKGAIVPAAVGVDIGCGMIAVETFVRADQLPDNLSDLRHSIERSVPVSVGGYNSEIFDTAKARVYHLNQSSKDFYATLTKKHWSLQLGSLGSGNHFIEVCLDERDVVWIVLHSGSRGIGNKLAQYHITGAKQLMKDLHIQLDDPDLAYLPDKLPGFRAYIEDLTWAQEFALLNREEMMDRVIHDFSYFLFKDPEPRVERNRINCHHNFTQLENHMGANVWVTRKGAIQMRSGQAGVIPGSMGTRSYIVDGRGNVPSFESAPHGAGRNFSRTEARRRFTMEDFDREMEGVECNRSEKLLDEIPSAYKDIDEVMENSKELVSVRHTLKQILNVKGY
jgi:tRNA-splicing ligase RtcB